MAQLILAKGNHYRRGMRKRTIAENVEVSPLILVATLIAFIALTSVIYLVNFNQVAMKGYDIKRLDDEYRQLLDTNERGQNQLSELTSLARIRESEKVQTMVRPRNVIYVRGDTVMAVAH